MSIRYQILGKPGKDNALMVWINAGTKMYKLLFDCGENIFSDLKPSDVSSIDYLFFSHLHLDHAAGFDYFFRRNYDRNKQVNIYGPQNTADIIHHHMLGYTWNLVDGVSGEWFVTDISKNSLATSKFLTSEGFSKKHSVKKTPFKKTIIDNEHFKVEMVLLNHIIPSAAYKVTEKKWFNIDKTLLVQNNFNPGAWLDAVKKLSIDGRKKINIEGKVYTLKELRKLLLIEHDSDSIAYLTDFIYDRTSVSKAKKLIKDCKTIICESQYSKDDAALAKKNYHLITEQAAALARDSSGKKLILFHISERYHSKEEYSRLLKEARNIFPNTFFPEEWEIKKS